MPRFRPGQSGNPSGRPKSAAGLRELLEHKYGSDAAVLVGRLERLSNSRNPRTAYETTRLLMEYLCGRPEHRLAVHGEFQHTQFVPMAEDRLSRLSNDELAVLKKLNGPETPTDE